MADFGRSRRHHAPRRILLFFDLYLSYNNKNAAGKRGANELLDRSLFRHGDGHRRCGHAPHPQPAGPMSTAKTACLAPSTVKRAENRGLARLTGAFVICPCHLPLTLAMVGTLLSGTAIGAFITGHSVVAGVVITLT
jgi:hypothetical protein